MCIANARDDTSCVDGNTGVDGNRASKGVEACTSTSASNHAIVGVVPIVNLSPCRLATREGMEAAASEVRKACHEIGFFYASGRNVEHEASVSLIIRAREFFALPAADKEKIRMSKTDKKLDSSSRRQCNPIETNSGDTGRDDLKALGRFVPRGYFGIGQEYLDHEDDFESNGAPTRSDSEGRITSAKLLSEGTRSSGDLKEGFDVGACRIPTSIEEENKWPEFVQTSTGRASGEVFRESAVHYSNLMLNFSQSLLQIFGIASDTPRDTFFVDNSITPVATLRILHYPGKSHEDSKTTSTGVDLACGAHSDYGLCTILCDGGAPGLQVLPPGKADWVDVPPIPGTFIINTGAMMHRWTDGKLQNTIHRVVHHAGVKNRISIPFFLNPSPSAVIEPIRSDSDTVESQGQRSETCANIIARRYLQSGLASNS